MNYLLDTCLISELAKSEPNKTVVDWVLSENDLSKRFHNRIIGIDIRVSITWGKIQRIAEKKGIPMPAIDSLIAATGIVHDLTVASGMQQIWSKAT
jgi:toxin FitB